ncbi:Immunity protein 26 [Flavobacterium omnivorum]|jgi:hypothetical protein|uniref:Immunity protein 26 n=1 Tax=Flavobacterium omnivorum TaxID=178355 RepID=A0A1G7WRY0_9FLAO|nr:Imm26 family immunity protein [Flavobacterium omnivorum]SDG74702.1 Immunity protein 26 [Flavobacterium omnivorum]
MKKQKITQGSILEINIENQYYTYAQILDKGGYVFFDYKSETRLTDFSVLEDKPILFIIGVYNDVITQGHWPIVGKMNIRQNLNSQPMQFIQDALHPDRFEFYNPNTGESTPATKEKVKGLERAAVWEANHVEDRIRDYYNGVPCIWLEDDLELFKD